MTGKLGASIVDVRETGMFTGDDIMAYTVRNGC